MPPTPLPSHSRAGGAAPLSPTGGLSHLPLSSVPLPLPSPALLSSRWWRLWIERGRGRAAAIADIKDERIRRPTSQMYNHRNYEQQGHRSQSQGVSNVEADRSTSQPSQQTGTIRTCPRAK